MVKSIEWIKKACNVFINLLLFAFFTLVVFLAAVQVGVFYRKATTYQFMPIQNGYNVFDDIFSDIEDLRKSIQSRPNSTQDNETISKVNALQETVSKIAETVMESPDQAITAKLLKNDQGAIKDRTLKLESDVIALNGRIDTMYTIIFTLIVALLGFKGFVAFIRKENKD